jgi:iron complex outermembrane receptor protein
MKVAFQNTRFGKTVIAPAYTDPATRITSFLSETFSPKILTDIRLTYSPKKWISVTLGTNNIFDVYPDRLKDYNNTAEGLYIYSQEATPFGFNGGYYFLSIEIKG